MQGKEDKDNTYIVHAPKHRFKEGSVNIDDMKSIMFKPDRKILSCVQPKNWYIMVMYKMDGNLILVKPMKTRTSGEMCKE